MQASQDALAGQGLVVLDKVFVDTVGRKKILAVGLHKVPPGIAKNPGLYDEETGQGSGLEIHKVRTNVESKGKRLRHRHNQAELARRFFVDTNQNRFFPCP